MYNKLCQNFLRMVKFMKLKYHINWDRFLFCYQIVTGFQSKFVKTLESDILELLNEFIVLKIDV